MRVSVVFTDGARYVGKTFADVEEQIRKDAWNPYGETKYRHEMTWRADVWSQWQLNPQASPETFLRGMESAGLIRMEVEQ